MNGNRTDLRNGIFAVSAVLLLILMLFYFGLSEIFVRKIKMVTYFSESVQGLSVGSDVKYRGVKVGSVRDISILADKKLIRVEMEVELKRFTGITAEGKGDVSEENFKKFIADATRQGLRCRLEFQGITGMKYIDFDYFADPVKELSVTPGRSSADVDAVYIASVSSSYKDILLSMTSAMERISQVRFEAVFEELESVLESIHKTISDPALKKTLDNVSRASANIEAASGNLRKVLDEERLAKIIKLLEDDLAAFGKLSAALEQTTRDMKLPESSGEFRETARSVTELKQELSGVINRLNETLAQISKLCEKLNDDPGFIIGNGSGK